MTSRKTLVNELKRAIQALDDDDVIKTAMGLAAFALFPMARAGERVEHSEYYASDCPGRAIEEYLDRLGQHETFNVDMYDDGLEGLPSDWQESIESVIAEDDYLGKHWDILREIFSLGIKEKARQLREQALRGDLAGAIDYAMDSIEAQDYR